MFENIKARVLSLPFLSQMVFKPTTNQPLANTPMGGIIATPFGAEPEVNYKMLWVYIKSSAEAFSIISAIMEDVVSDGYVLEGGRNKKKVAEKFLFENNFKSVCVSWLADILVTGDGYLYKQKIEEAQLRQMAKRYSSKLPNQYKALIEDTVVTAVLQDEDVKTTKRFLSIPSSTMRLIYDKHGNVEKYLQIVGNNRADFTKDEIYHFKYMELDGKVYGYSPTLAMMPILDIIRYIRENARFTFERGGTPQKIYLLPKHTMNSPQYKAVKAALQEFHAVSEQHKSLVLAGTEIKIEDLSKLTDMEYKELARYLTQVLVMIWKVPASRLSDLLISAGMRGSATSSEGYYRMISDLQSRLEDAINSFLLTDYGVTFKFNRFYKQDELREAQIQKLLTDTVQQRLSLNLIDREQAAHALGLNPEDLPPEKDISVENNQLNQNKINNVQMLSEGIEKPIQANDKQSAALSKR